jgi:Chaperone of endosialidase/Domain of unknown function (DUF5011)
VGYQALKGSATVSSTGSNTAIGYKALTSITSGNANTAVGYNAASSLTTSGSTAAFGYEALFNHTGNQNTAIGALSLIGSGSGSNNTALGFQAGHSDTSGANNVFLGTNAASTTASGSNNIALGYDIALPSINGSNQLNIGNLIFGTGINGEGTNLSTGNIGIGTTTPYSRLTVWGTDTASTSPFAVVNSASTTVFAVYDNGNATYSGSIFQSSDQRLKTNVQPLDASSSLSLIAALNPVSYTRLDQTAQGTNLGFIAQQVQQVFPELVSTTSPTALTPDGTLTLNYVGLISPIVAAVQALMHQLTSLEATVAGFADNFVSTHITVTTGDFQEVNTQKLCVGSACVTPAQFLAMIAAANQSPATAQPGPAGKSTLPGSVTQNGAASTTPGTPPVIQINGDNPAIIHVGDSYADLGATITGPQSDLNLGIKTFLNGQLVSNIVIDTSSQATDTIDYVATDSTGLTATSTRTVIVSAPQAANDNQASTTPAANDNNPPLAATSTSATSSAQ